MKVQQVYELVNDISKEVLGKEDLIKEDLSNVVDLGKEVFDADAMDNYVKSLVNRIGKVVFVDRPYQGSVPSVYMDSWEYGSIMQKITAELPTATETQDWNLKDGQVYDTQVFYEPKVTAKFFNSKTTFSIPVSITEKQVKESFTDANQLNAFISMIRNSVEKALTVRMDSLVMSTINRMTAQTLFSEYPTAGYNTKSGIRAINLLKEYNDRFSKSLTPAQAITDPEFIRHASVRIALTSNRMSRISTLFNIGGKERFTSTEMQRIIMLNDFKMAADAYLQSELFNEKYTALPNADTVPYWQGSGKSYDLDSISSINVEYSEENEKQTVEASGILAVMFDRESLGVTNLDRRVTTAYNAVGEFYNNYYKVDAGYFTDTNENYVVFFMA